MAHLADIDSGFRTFGKIAAVFTAAIVVLFVVIMGGSFAKNLLFPTPPPPPGEKFGALPPLDFPSQTPRSLTYNINTLSGTLPDLGTKISGRMDVYKVKIPEASLTALAHARDELSSAGYAEGETKLSETVYQWSNKESESSIQYNITNHNFKISSDLLSAPPAELSGIAATGDGAYESITNFLESIGEDTKNLDPEKTIATYLKVQDGVLVAAQSQNEAQYIRVDLYQKNINDFPVYFPGNNQSIMHFILKSEGFNPIIVDAEYTNPEVDTEAKSDYPITTAAAALEKLKDGEALILYTGKSDTVDVTDVGLGYYVSPNQQYFMPVIVFKGKNFLGLVNAISQ